MRTLAGGARLMTGAEMLQIHETMLAILAEPGIEMQLPERGLKRLADAGLRVDFATRRVRFDPAPVLETIRQLSGADSPDIDETGNVKPPQPLRLPTRLRANLGSTHGFIFDVDRWDLRDANRQDYLNFKKIARSLEDVDPRVGMMPQDVPPEVAYIHRAALSCLYDESPGASANGRDDGPWVTRVLQAAGVLGPDAPPVMSSHMQPTGALIFSARAAEDMLEAAEAGRLSYLLPCGFAGGNHPVTRPGALAAVYAEVFGCNTVARLLVDPPHNHYTPRTVGCDQLIMDLRRGAFCIGSPEGLQMRLGMRQMSGDFYRFPGGSGNVIATTTDSPVPGQQASLEWALGQAVELMAGLYSYEPEVTAQVKSLGRLHANLALCAEQVLMDYEGLQWLRRFFTGPEVNADTLALEAVRAVGPGGEYVTAQHTLEHYREAFWFPTLLHRGAWGDYVAHGQRTMLDLAKDRVQEILKQDLPPVLDDDRCRAVAQVVEEAEMALLGRKTGVPVI
jgi:trimethylamine--corrinoid protein Co-methyltransferase